MLYIYDDDDELLIWACEARSSDDIMLVIADRSCADINDMFNDIAWKSAKYFKYEDYNSAVNYAFNVIKKSFSKHFTEDYVVRFKMHKNLNEIKRISLDAKDLEYEDYYDLATFEDINNLYFCDLIIDNGNLGLRYSKYTDDIRDDYENLSFEKWNPDLTSNTTLMLGMQNKLKDFIDAQIDYEIDMGMSV